jgi:hypothetical protein
VPVPRTSGRERRRTSSSGRLLRIAGWLLIASAVLTVAVLVLIVPGTLRLREGLLHGRHAMEQARSALVSGDERRASALFSAARRDFDEAVDDSGGGLLGLMGHIPVIGGNVRVVRSIAVAGSTTGEAGEAVTNAIDALPGGLEALAAVQGRIPLERFPALAGAVGRAADLVAAALSEVRSTAGTLGVLSVVEDARWQAETSLRDLDGTISAAAAILERLPAFLGGDRARTYLFGASNPAELRGTGGLIGAYSLLRADEGRLSFSSFRPVQSLPLLDANALPAPNPDYRRLYDPQRTGDGFWLNANMTPDFPSAAQALETAFAAATGRRVDGVVTADPFALQALLGAVGSVRVPGLGVTVTGRNVVPFLANRAYARIDDSARRKLVLGQVAETIVERFVAAAGGGQGVRTIAQAAGDGHVLLYANDPRMESGLMGTAAGGAFRFPGGRTDQLSVVVNNGAGNKVDYYVDRDVRYDVRLEPNGNASATTGVTLENHAPTHGPPPYVLGPLNGVTTKAGQDVAILNVYCGRCALHEASVNDASISPGQDQELGSNFFQDYFRMDPGSTTRADFRYRSTATWSGDGSGGTYTLRFLNQTTIRPTTLAVTIRVPSGMHVTGASDGVVVDGSIASWTGTPGRILTIDLSFEPSLPERLWRALVD